MSALAALLLGDAEVKKRWPTEAGAARWLERHPRPACFESDAQWLRWYAAADLTKLLPWRAGPPIQRNHCLDCTEEYADRMQREGRCDSPVLPHRTRAKLTLETDAALCYGSLTETVVEEG